MSQQDCFIHMQMAMKRRQQQLGCRFLYLQLLQKHQNPFLLTFFFYSEAWLSDIFPSHHQVTLHSLWNLSTKELATFLHKAIHLYPSRVITHLWPWHYKRTENHHSAKLPTISIIRPASFVRTPQSYASGLDGTIPLLLPSIVSFVNLCTLESDPTKALPKDSSLSSYSLHKLHLSPPQLLLPPRENFPYPTYYALCTFLDPLNANRLT